jgi:hypothetical protein
LPLNGNLNFAVIWPVVSLIALVALTAASVASFIAPDNEFQQVNCNPYCNKVKCKIIVIYKARQFESHCLKKSTTGKIPGN